MPESGEAGAPVLIINTSRKGEEGQTTALARAVGLPFRLVEPGEAVETEPALILSFGIALRPALDLHEAFGRRPVLVQLGRPRLVPPARLDLLILMPQDDYPDGPNTIHLAMPLNGATMERESISPCVVPGGTTSVLLGGPTRFFRYDDVDIARLCALSGRLARENGEALRIVPGPRTPHATRRLLERLYAARPEVIDTRGLDAVLQDGARLVVTADSASLIADAWRSGAPVWLYPLTPAAPLLQRLKIALDRVCGKLRPGLVRRGWLAGGTDFLTWEKRLAETGIVRLLTPDALTQEARARWRPAAPMADTELRLCRDRVRALLEARRNRTVSAL